MDPFLGEIRMFPWNWAPKGWLQCDGRLLNISQNQALFALLGVTYGGDGKVTFGLPDLRGRTPIGFDFKNRPGGLNKDGAKVKILPFGMIAPHSHVARVSTAGATLASPAGGIPATCKKMIYHSPSPSPDKPLATIHQLPETVSLSGQGQGIDNSQPSIGMGFFIATLGTYPPRD